MLKIREFTGRWGLVHNFIATSELNRTLVHSDWWVETFVGVFYSFDHRIQEAEN